ncbi:unnamed protein product [Lepeophtheirus salmonis]|uniref:(salmon louse) hypothetical protein n=1 Tax=Lepeophtheirus salmonis TaxID=72036 RepID=A0A7R8CH05_LEPSM|nr:unnamed protein product [Lepeophtheirus salmonis]CAF2819993.1 unnamed protein product [Lepeophtheirus salmonis]
MDGDDGQHCCYAGRGCVFFEERFNVEPLSHSMNPKFLIHDGLMLLSVDSMLMKSAPKLRHEEGVHPIQKGVLFLLKGKLTLGEKATSGRELCIASSFRRFRCSEGKKVSLLETLEFENPGGTSEASPPPKQTGDALASESRTDTLLDEEINGKSGSSLTQHCSSVQTNTKSTIHEPRLSPAMTHNS